MKIYNKEYRIIEETYEDDHKKYHVEKLIFKFLFIKFWKDYIYRIDDCGYGSIVYKYRFHTYQECIDYLKKNIEEKEQAKKKVKIINKQIFK